MTGQVFGYALRGSTVFVGPLESTPLQAGRPPVRLLRPVRVDYLFQGAPSRVAGGPPSIVVVTQVTDLRLPWIDLIPQDLLWSGDPETTPGMEWLYKMYHQVIRGAPVSVR